MTAHRPTPPGHTCMPRATARPCRGCARMQVGKRAGRWADGQVGGHAGGEGGRVGGKVGGKTVK
eukprot:133767-Chlamydomonas_euryale.AAC.1